MSRKFLDYLRDFVTSRAGWLLVIANLLFFAYLFEEITLMQNISRGYCDENGTRHFGLVQPSNFFQLFVLLNLPSIISGQKLAEIIFWNFNDTCVNYSYDKYPFVYIGKLAVMLLCQSIQWFLIGYGFEKVFRLMKNRT